MSAVTEQATEAVSTQPHLFQHDIARIVAGLPPPVAWLLRRFPQLMLAGGAVRDLLLGLRPRDWDLVIVADHDPRQAYMERVAATPEHESLGLVPNTTGHDWSAGVGSLGHLLTDPEEWVQGVTVWAEREIIEGASPTLDPATAHIAYAIVFSGCKVTASDKAVTIHAPSGAYARDAGAIQICRMVHPTPAAAFASFDFTVCRAGLRLYPPAWDPKPATGFELRVGPAFEADTIARRLVFCGPENTTPQGSGAGDSLVRALRFMERGQGWTIAPSEVEAILACRFRELAARGLLAMRHAPDVLARQIFRVPGESARGFGSGEPDPDPVAESMPASELSGRPDPIADWLAGQVSTAVADLPERF